MIVTLTTDFGITDSFVGIMKGIILSTYSKAIIVDITHDIPAQDTKKAYYVLQQAARYFPPDTLHVIVVDPTVGSERRVIYVETEHQKFLAPDNGLLSFIEQSAIRNIYEICHSQYTLDNVSNTFHGRDIFAPIAGHLLGGVSPEKLGKKIEPLTMNRWLFPDPKIYNNNVCGEIVYIDHFGNLISNIHSSLVNMSAKAIRVNIQQTEIQGISQHYSEVPPENLLALFNSSNLLEIACNLGNAARKLGIKEGHPVRCSWD